VLSSWTYSFPVKKIAKHFRLKFVAISISFAGVFEPI
jgi:hypothetical protein